MVQWRWHEIILSDRTSPKTGKLDQYNTTSRTDFLSAICSFTEWPSEVVFALRRASSRDETPRITATAIVRLDLYSGGGVTRLQPGLALTPEDRPVGLNRFLLVSQQVRGVGPDIQERQAAGTGLSGRKQGQAFTAGLNPPSRQS
jgi:hypothetical protein